MTALDRRTLMATPTTLGAGECSTMDWITMSLQARNLAYKQCRACRPRERAQENRSVGRSRQQSQRCGLLEAKLALGAKNIASEIGNPPPSV
jgi:hypothetical protein